MTVPPRPTAEHGGDPDSSPEPVKPVVDRALLDRIFGTVLPDTTSDERGPESGSRGDEDWYRSNRPPHHG